MKFHIGDGSPSQHDDSSPRLRLDEPATAWLRVALAKAGVPPSDPDGFDPYLDLLCHAAQVWSATQDVHATATQALLSLGVPDTCLPKLSGAAIPRQRSAVEARSWEEFAAICIRNGVDFTAGLQKLVTRVEVAALVLHAQGLIDISRLVDVKRCQELAPFLWSAQPGIPSKILNGTLPADRAGEVAAQSCASYDVSSPFFWLAIVPAALEPLIDRAFQDVTDDDAASLARGLVVGTACAPHPLGYDAARFAEIAQERYAMGKNVLALLERRLSEKPSSTTRSVRHAALEIRARLRQMSASVPELIPPAVRSLATYELACTRSSLANRAEEQTTLALDESTRAVTEAALETLRETGSTWTALRPALLLLRHCPVPTLAPDLRYWRVRARRSTDQDARVSPYPGPIPEMPDPPVHWAFIPRHIAECVHGITDEALKEDVGLVRLRTQFARHCLDHLVSAERGGPPIEPSAHWRTGYLRAMRALRVNPHGTGHNVIRYVADSDPDPSVRALAESMFNKVRGGPRLGDESPRVTCFDAIWHLFAAHMSHLGVPAAPEAAQRTRARMIRRTTEPKHTGEEELHLM